MADEKFIRSPLKWAGGKYRILSQIKSHLPPGRRLLEPFVGSGALFLNSEFSRYVLNDVNSHLIKFYRIIKRDGEGFILYARKFFTPENNSEEVYYKFRSDFNATVDEVYKAALFLYLNKFGYNGLCRYNARGEFNVPFGRHTKPYFPERELRYFIKKAKKTIFYCKDFEEILKSAKTGDVVYCDPPYVPLSETANFTQYNAGGFDMEDQLRLAKAAEELSSRGIPIIISNHYTKFTKQAYKHATRHTFNVRRFISCNGSKRENAREVLAVFK